MIEIEMSLGSKPKPCSDSSILSTHVGQWRFDMNRVVIDDVDNALGDRSLDSARGSMLCAIMSRLDGTTRQSSSRGRSEC